MNSHTTVTHQSWFDRLRKSCGGVCLGLLLFLAAPALLFWNEGRAIETTRGISEASAAVLPNPLTTYAPRNDGLLVAVVGVVAAPLVSAEGAADAGGLPDSVAAGLDGYLEILQNRTGGSLLYLRRDVSYYEWNEDMHTEKSKTAGGGETTTTTYTYNKDWTTIHHDSSSFNDQWSYQNPRPQYTDKAFTTTGTVELRVSSGQDTQFSLSSQLVDKVISRSHGGTNVGPSVVYRPSTDTIAAAIDPPGPPIIGDHRFSWSAVGPTVVSAIAEQQSSGQLSTWLSPNGRSFYTVTLGANSIYEMILLANTENERTTWLLRAGGFALWWFALSLMAGPLSVVADVATIPFLGIEPGTMVEYLTGCVAFLVAAVLSIVTIAVAWMFYRPVFSVLILLGAGGIFYGVRKMVVNKKRSRDRDINYELPHATEVDYELPHATKVNCELPHASEVIYMLPHVSEVTSLKV